MASTSRQTKTNAKGLKRMDWKRYGVGAIGLAGLVLMLAARAHGMAARGADGGEVTLAENGRARTVIVVPPDVMTWEGHDRPVRGEFMADAIRSRWDNRRDSILDLAHYLGKMIGDEVEIVEALPDGDPRVPIYIDTAAEPVFGPVGISMAKRFGFRVVADTRRGIGLFGEAECGTSYAIYEFLHNLGCRWFMPSEMGEVVPETPDLTVAVMDEQRAPATEYRRFQGRLGDNDFRRRNRMGLGSDRLREMHALEGYISNAQLEENPEWRKHNADGTPRSRRFRWTREDVAHAIADRIIEQLDDDYRPSVSLSPGDYVRYTEDPEERKHDPEPRVWEPAAGRWSVTDRLYMLANRVAERVGEKYPDVLFGVYAYVNYNMPPGRERVHPNVIPVIAPIDFNRHHPMTWTNHPNEFWLRDMLEGWSQKADRIGYYAYGMNLAELSAPCPFITKWSVDLPIIMQNNTAFWMAESMNGWESMMPGHYLSFRLTFDPTEDPAEILEDMWTRFYGAAADPMGRYWHHVDRAWIEAEEFAGCGFGYLRIFTPEVMQKARALIDEALAASETEMETRRVRLIDETFALFELFMKMRQDFAAADFATIGADLDQWRETLAELQERYRRPQYVLFERNVRRYVDRMYGEAYEAAARMAAEYERHGTPMLEWKWKHNPDEEEAALPWTAPDYEDSHWPSKHVVRDTWSSIGHHNTLTDRAADESGRMVYRASQQLDAVPDGKRVWLWIGSTDGSAKVYVNGEHVPWVDGRGNERLFSNYARAASWDVTDQLKTGENRFAILAERLRLNELGTGGLMGPVVLYKGSETED